MYALYIKRIIDLLISFIFIFIFSPLLIAIYLFLLFSTKSNPLFYQLRPGSKKRIFKLMKFKTMNDSKDVSGKYLPDALRITRAGKFLRNSSLDELPQLFNVLKGDMSIIGPRPLLVRYLDLYNSEQARRHDVRPGITGWAQVNGRNALSWEKKFELDVWYVDNLSFSLDFKILWLTIKKVLLRENVNNSETITMNPFTGSGNNKS
jgi:lipopolysaccharide/colanic/teichoic acid biosynthesis glycosyltransferase